MDNKSKAAIAVSAVFLIWFGFRESNASITKCESTVTKYVTAEFSELVTGIDMEGNIYSEMDYWSDQASLKFTVVSADGGIESISHDFNTAETNGYFVPPMPEHDKSIKSELHFDNFKFRVDSSLRVYTYSDGDHDSFSDPINLTTECISKLQTEIVVKEWYWISYSSEWSE